VFVVDVVVVVVVVVEQEGEGIDPDCARGVAASRGRTNLMPQ